MIHRKFDQSNQNFLCHESRSIMNHNQFVQSIDFFEIIVFKFIKIRILHIHDIKF